MKTPAWKEQPEGRFFTRIDVARVLSGAMLRLGLHVVTGRRDGPTLGIIGGVHGDETLTPMAFKVLLDSLDPADMSGRLAVIPVCNPPAMAVFNRQTPEQHGNTDLFTVFPGNPATGNLTHKIAVTIRQNLIDHVDAFVDFHCGGSGGRLQNRSDFEEAAAPAIREKSFALCRAFGAPFVHANNLHHTASAYANSRGIPTCNPEVGGTYLSRADTRGYLDSMAAGLKGIMRSLQMLPETGSAPPPRQLFFEAKGRIEVNPGMGGFLQSEFESPSDLGKLIAKGTLLGRIIDMNRLKIVEDLISPAAGYLFFSRYSGVVDAGTKAFGIARKEGSKWLK